MLLSPAKTVDENACRAGIPQAEPRLKEHTLELLQILKKKSVADVKKLMSVSDDIAKLNVGRYKDFEKLKAKQAVLLFDGVAFKGLKAIGAKPRKAPATPARKTKRAKAV
eukprot:jgi/Pico_ML_1/52033/g2806.t1